MRKVPAGYRSERFSPRKTWANVPGAHRILQLRKYAIHVEALQFNGYCYARPLPRGALCRQHCGNSRNFATRKRSRSSPRSSPSPPKSPWGHIHSNRRRDMHRAIAPTAAALSEAIRSRENVSMVRHGVECGERSIARAISWLRLALDSRLNLRGLRS